MDDAAIAHGCEHEIVELHRFFTEWFHGTVPETDEAWSRVTNVLGPDFVLVSPDGHRLERGPLLDGIRARHGGHGPTQDFEIWIRNLACRPVSAELVLATYEEWQRREGEECGRISTALFALDRQTPNGVRWLHVHETWLPGAE